MLKFFQGLFLSLLGMLNVLLGTLMAFEGGRELIIPRVGYFMLVTGLAVLVTAFIAIHEAQKQR